MVWSGCTNGQIGSTGEGGSGNGGGTTSSQGAGGAGGTTSTGASGGVGGGGAATSSGGVGAATSSGGVGGSGGAASADPCAGASDGDHCGGELGGLADHNSVYACSGGVSAQVSGCPNGCEGGACLQAASDPCVNAGSGNGAYCGASLGAGEAEKNKLFQCQNGMTASKKDCANGCKVQPPGTPDSCIPSGDPCAGASSGNGLYCGGSLAAGDPNVLYDCQNMATASSTTCVAGCQMMPAGVADACAPVGGGECCLNKPPGVLTQSYSACGNGGVHYGIDLGTPVGTPIYAGMSGTIVSHALGFPNCYDNGCSSSCWNAFNYVKLKSDCGDPNEGGHDFFIYYLHIDDMAAGLGNGSHVDQGQLLAHSGNSGCSSGPHIHIETASVPAGQSTGLSTCNSQNPAGNYCP